MIPAGTSVSLKLLRGDEPFDVEVVLARNVELGPLEETQE